MKLKTYDDLTGLTIYDDTCVNVRRDILKFISFLEIKEIKRGHRDNNIPKAAALQLGKILSYDYKKEKSYIEKNNNGFWSDKISYLLLNMDIVDFDTEGEYMGYHSNSTSYPDNYIEIDNKKMVQYLSKNNLKKDSSILEGLSKNENEFHQNNGFISLKKFSASGSGVNASSVMDLPEIRKAILSILAQLEPDTWYDMNSLIAYFKNNHFNLIIDRNKKFDFSRKGNIYSSFYDAEWQDNEIKETDKNAYKKVEGRYLEYFLEYIPLIMGFVSLAVDEKKAEEIKKPAINYIKAFKIHKKLIDFINKSSDYEYRKVTVQPNFEIIIDPAYGYEEGIILFLEKICNLIKENNTITYKLDKKKVTDELASGFNINELIDYLETVSESSLPSNIKQELLNWSEYSEKITLIKKKHILELSFDKDINNKITELISDNIIDKIDDNLYIIMKPSIVIEKLKNNDYLPRQFKYSNKLFTTRNYEFSRYSKLFKIKKERTIIKEDLNIKKEKYISISIKKKYIPEIASIINNLLVKHFIFSNRIFFPIEHEEKILLEINKFNNKYNITIQ